MGEESDVVKTMVEQILVGRADTGLNDLLQAILERVKVGVVSSEWVITDAAGVSLRESDITVGQAERVESLCSVPWSALNPAQSAGQFRSIVQAALESGGDDAVAARKKVEALKAVDAINCVSSELVEPVPFGSGQPETT